MAYRNVPGKVKGGIGPASSRSWACQIKAGTWVHRYPWAVRELLLLLRSKAVGVMETREVGGEQQFGGHPLTGAAQGA